MIKILKKKHNDKYILTTQLLLSICSISLFFFQMKIDNYNSEINKIENSIDRYARSVSDHGLYKLSEDIYLSSWLTTQSSPVFINSNMTEKIEEYVLHNRKRMIIFLEKTAKIDSLKIAAKADSISKLEDLNFIKKLNLLSRIYRKNAHYIQENVLDVEYKRRDKMQVKYNIFIILRNFDIIIIFLLSIISSYYVFKKSLSKNRYNERFRINRSKRVRYK